ncbi:TRAFs-binding domain-containing protein [Blastococcus sp. SYSU DS1021]
MRQDPYCFVLMPFGKRSDPAGGAAIDFDAIYRDALLPAIESVGMQAYRDDMTAIGGIVQKQIYEALLLSQYAIADLTLENANVFYELGVRHAVRPASTLTITARPDAVPFDVRHLRTLRYHLDKHNALTDVLARQLRDGVSQELREVQQRVAARPTFADSPLFQLVEGWRPQQPESLKTDLFAERVAYNEDIKRRLSRARAAALRAPDNRQSVLTDVFTLHEGLRPLEGAEAGSLVDLLLTYRALEEWDVMIALVEEMPGHLRERALVQEQLAFALNRRASRTGEADRDEALAVLLALHEQNRSSSETFGLMGRIHKDRWRSARDPDQRRMHLEQAIRAYEYGFQMDPRDPYPGINAATLMRAIGITQEEPRLARLLCVVEYAVERLVVTERPTYWTFASLMELAVLRGDYGAAEEQLRRALAVVRESWEPATTLENLADLLESGAMGRADVGSVNDLIGRLRRASDQ